MMSSSAGPRSSLLGATSGCLLSTVVATSLSNVAFSCDACWSTMRRSLPRRATMKPRLNWPTMESEAKSLFWKMSSRWASSSACLV